MDVQDRLHARPPSAAIVPERQGVTPGLHKLPLQVQRDSYIFAPKSYSAAHPGALVLLLHGAGGHAHDGLRVLLHLAEQEGLILAAPASHEATWDIIAGRRYGRDLALVDEVLDHVLRHYAVDSRRLAVGGFSDGASYALSLGLNNGDLFSHVLAFSPGFVGPGTRRGRPRVFISHGTRDRILPIDPCSRSIVRELRAQGYALDYREFEGEHVIPPEIAAAAVDWLSGQAG
jgi:predicted esterase